MNFWHDGFITEEAKFFFGFIGGASLILILLCVLFPKTFAWWYEE
jgi:hypothetical protein